MRFYCILFIWNWLCKWGKVEVYFHFLSKWVFVVQPWLNTTCVICQMAICATDLVNQFLPSLFYSTGLDQCLIQPCTVFITTAKSESGCLGGRVLPPLGFLPFYINLRSSTESLTGPVGFCWDCMESVDWFGGNWHVYSRESSLLNGSVQSL